MKYTKDDLIVLPLTFIIMVTISIILGLTLKNKSQKMKRIPFLVITIILIILELIKQMRSLIEGYSMWTFPLHFCSTFFVWFSLAEFTKGKFSESMKSVATVATFYLLALFYFDPDSIIGSDTTANIFSSFSTFHTFFFHHLAMLYFMLSISLNQFHPTKRDIFVCFVSMFIYFIIALTFAHIFDTNYVNMLRNNIGFMENIRTSYGQIVYSAVMGALISLSGPILLGLYIIIKSFFKYLIIKLFRSKNYESV